MLVVKADVEVTPNPNEISDIKCVELELLDQIMDGEVSDDMIAWKTKGTALYQELPKECRTLMKECEPLSNM